MPDNLFAAKAIHASWCEVFTNRISENLRLALKLLPKGKQFCAVLKADAYGHGIDKVVPIVRAAGIKYVGITSNAEAKAVREAGYTGIVMRLRSATRAEIVAALPDLIQEQVGSLYAAQIIREMVRQDEKIQPVHLSLNAAGMSRDGLELSGETGQHTCLKILDLVGPQISGICSHFPSNFQADLAASNQKFQQDVDWVFDNSALKRRDMLVHAGSSLTLVSDQKVTTDLYRCGAIMYGILNGDQGFQPTMELKSRVTNLAPYPKGSTIGYDRASALLAERRLANISIGYSNGIGRQFFGQSSVLIHGQMVPILGKISMNAIVADVTDIQDIAIGDEVTLFGQQGSKTIDVKVMERQAETIMADIFADFGQRNHRIYVG